MDEGIEWRDGADILQQRSAFLTNSIEKVEADEGLSLSGGRGVGGWGGG